MIQKKQNYLSVRGGKWHKNYSHEYTDNPSEYRSWDRMKQRCLNSDSDEYERYGGRGITVCERWLDEHKGLHNFLQDMGPRPKGCSLDRIDDNGNYTPENCRWANRSMQSYNQTSGEHSTNSIGVSLQYKGKKHRPYYTAHITKDYKLYRKTFHNYMDALIWRAKQEENLYGTEAMQAGKLIALVMGWGRRHKINNPDKQMLKVVEETAEIAREIVRGNYGSDEIKDSIGDTLVTVVILADILGLNPVEELQKAYKIINARKGETKSGTFIKKVDLKEKTKKEKTIWKTYNELTRAERSRIGLSAGITNSRRGSSGRLSSKTKNGLVGREKPVALTKKS